MHRLLPCILLAVLGCGGETAPDAEVDAALRRVVAAQVQFHQRDTDGNGRYDFATRLEALDPWLDPPLRADSLPGYALVLRAEAGGRWSLAAEPEDAEAPGWFVDCYGFVRRSAAGPAERSSPLAAPPAPGGKLTASPAYKHLRDIAAKQGLYQMADWSGEGEPRFACSLRELTTPEPIELGFGLVDGDYAYLIEAPRPRAGWTAWAVPLVAGLPLFFVDESGTVRVESDRAPSASSPAVR